MGKLFKGAQGCEWVGGNKTRSKGTEIKKEEILKSRDVVGKDLFTEHIGIGKKVSIK